MFIHDIIKIRYVYEGYLPNYPYHLISDIEMCDAFLQYPTEDELSGIDPDVPVADQLWDAFLESDRIMFFRDYYCYPFSACENGGKLMREYRELIESIVWHLNQLKSSSDDVYTLPDWVYSYMLGEVLGPLSNKQDLHDLFTLLDTDNLEDEFNDICGQACLNISNTWLPKLSADVLLHRAPTIFGEPHVIKFLRLREANLIEEE